MARILAGLWPVYRGLVSRPKNTGEDGIMFLPQRPYLSPGTLRDQVIYPDGEADMREKRKSDDDLKRVLDEARLGYLPEREGGWDTRKEWKDVLSGGEKQRMGFARLLYHEPQYAVIDEGTSAVSSDVEGLLYETCRSKGISEYHLAWTDLQRWRAEADGETRPRAALITMSTRASLKKYHTYNLVLGLGERGDEWAFEAIGTEREKLQVEKELQEIRERLAQVEDWKRRKQEIEEELATVWTDHGAPLEAPAHATGPEAGADAQEAEPRPDGPRGGAGS